MNRLSCIRLLSLLAFAVSPLITGCNLSTTASPAVETATGSVLQGKVHGGSQPVVGAHVHVMAASTSGYGGAATSLLQTNLAGTDSIGGYVTTDANGAFSVTSDYVCVVGSQVYLLATQGNPGLPNNQTNPNLALMAVLGSCPAAGTFAATVPFVWISEATTVASVYALSGFMTDLTHVGSSGTPLALTAIANAFSTANNLFSVATGAALTQTPAGNGVPPQTEINTLANILASCVNTVGASATTCSTLFSNALNGTIQPTDTVTAALNIAHNPTANISNLFGLQASVGSPYAPALTGAPNDFTVAITYSGGGIYGATSIAIDGASNVWMVNGNNSLTEINGVTGAAISPATGFTGGGLSGPFSIAIDELNNAWVVNPATYNYVTGTFTAPTSVSEFLSTGAPAPLSPFTGGGLSIADNFNTLSPRDIAFDALGNFWVANNGATVSKFTGAGVPVSTTAYPLGTANPDPNGVAVDGAGNLWVSGFNGNVLSEVNTLTGAVEFTSAYDANGLQQPYSIAIDSSNSIWLPNQYDPNTLVGADISKFSSTGGSTGVYGGGGILGPDGVAIDGAGNVWISNEIHSSITELNNTGAALSPGSGFLSAGLFEGGDIAVDLSGNVWVPNVATPTYATGTTVIEFVGASVPVVTPLATAVATGKVGARP